jgi:zinc/manganese transport system substrate-binding protein
MILNIDYKLRTHRRTQKVNRTRTFLVVVVVAAMTLGACGTATSGSDDLRIVVTTSTLGDLVSKVVGSDATVEILMPIGADPHSFSPSSRQVAALSDADLVVTNGLGLEENFSDVLEGVIGDGGSVLDLGSMLDPIPFGVDDEDHEEEDHGEEEDDDHTLDPHIWMDPLRMADAARFVAEALSEVDDGIDWTARAASYSADLNELHTEIEGMLSPIDDSKRLLVTNHDALGYFAARYGFEVIGTVIPGGSTLGDPSSEDLASLVATMRELGVCVVFAETTRPSVLAEAVAAELGGEVQVVELFTGSLGEPGSGAETLIDLLRLDATRIAEALAPAG